MNELIIHITGSVVESNLEEFELRFKEYINTINLTLNTEEDFSQAKQDIDNLKADEQRIIEAKKKALSMMTDISALFDKLDLASAALATARLNLDKQVEKEKQRRKDEVINAALKSARDGVALILKENPLLDGVKILANEAKIRAGAANKKGLAGMEKGIAAAVQEELDRIKALAVTASLNMDRMIFADENGYPGLFPDRKTLCLLSEAEVASEIDRRIEINKLKLQNLELAKKVENQATAPTSAPLATVGHMPAAPVKGSTSTFSSSPSTYQGNTTAGQNQYNWGCNLTCSRLEAIEFGEKLFEFTSKYPFIVGNPWLKKDHV